MSRRPLLAPPLRIILPIGLALSLLGGAPQGPEKIQAAWSLEGSDLAIWDCSVLPAVEGGVETPRTPDLALVLYGYQIDRQGVARYPVTSIEEVAYGVALRVPMGKLKAGQTVKERVRFDQIRTYHPIDVLIQGEVKDVKEGSFRYEATFEGAPSGTPTPIPVPATWAMTVSGTFSADFDATRGVVTSAEIHLEQRNVHQDDGRKPDAPKPIELKHDFAFRLRKVQRYTPEWIEQSWKLNTPVTNAIEKGTAWLRDEVEADGTYGVYQEKYPYGETCLVALTLLVCGAERDDPFVVQLMDRIRGWDPTKTYEIGIALMAMEAFYAPADEITEVHLGRREAPLRRQPSREDLAWVQGLADRLIDYAKRDPDGWGWHYEKATGYVDLSNIQYAGLGLLSAWRCGATIPEEVWVGLARGVLRHMHGSGKLRLVLGRTDKTPPAGADGGADAPDRRKTRAKRRRGGPGTRTTTVEARGFDYYPGGKDPKGSMTCGGISTLRICRDVLLFDHPGTSASMIRQLDQAIDEGWGWMAENWMIQRHPTHHERHYLLYYLYSVERAGVLTGVDTVNGHDWFFEGASFLIATQHEDGRWVDRTGELHDTCFALLFLKRGTVPLPKPEKTGAGR